MGQIISDLSLGTRIVSGFNSTESNENVVIVISLLPRIKINLVARGFLDLPPLRGCSTRQTLGRSRPDRGKYAAILNL